METTYRLISTGQLAKGFTLERVRRNLAEFLKLPESEIDEIIATAGRPIRSNLDRSGAERYQSAFRRLGLETSIDQDDAASQLAAPDSGLSPSDAVAQTASIEPPARDIPFEFTGKAGEYFKIWIVNIALTLLTLGIYSAWAKVRTQRYFYANTKVNNDAFSYLASPIAILKGRLLAVVLLLIYLFSVQAYPSSEPFLLLALFIATPWIIVRAFRFRSRNSAFRNIRFGFDGQLGQAVAAYVGYPLLAVFSLGTLVPLAVKKQQEFRVANSRFGTQGFDFAAPLSAFYTIVILSGLIFFVFFILGAIAGAGSMIEFVGIQEAAAAEPGPAQADDNTGEPSAEAILAFYKGMMIPFGVMLLGAFTARVFYIAKTSNLMFNSSDLGGHRFRSTLAPVKLGFIMLTNWILIVLTLGLAYPWAMIRLANYRAANLTLLAASDLDGFVAAEGERINAVGEELGEAFDVDLGL